MQTYFFISIIIAIISYGITTGLMLNMITKANATTTKVYVCFLFSALATLSSLSTIGFSIAWIVEYNTTH